MLQKVRASEVVDVELSHDLAEEWLRDFNLESVIGVSSLSEAEGIVESWIREIRESRRVLEGVENVGEYVFGEAVGAPGSVEDGIDSIAKGEG